MDQAPLQNVAPDWKCGSTGCYDIASLTRLQCQLASGAGGWPWRWVGCGRGAATCGITPARPQRAPGPQRALPWRRPPRPADFKGFAASNAAFCTSLPLAPGVAKVLEAETLRAGGVGSVARPPCRSCPAWLAASLAAPPTLRGPAARPPVIS